MHTSPEKPHLAGLTCRPARAEDTGDVTALTRTIWDGHDYVPHVWPEWLADPFGHLAVAELDGQVIGLVKLTRFAADEWWLQGLRVDPAFQGQGVARRLHDYIVDFWVHNGEGTLRLSSYRPQVRHMCEGTGFTIIGHYGEYAAPALPGEELALRRVRKDALLPGGAWPVYSRFMDVGWTWINVTTTRLNTAAAEGRAWTNPAGDLWVVREEADEDGAARLWLEWIACPAPRLAANLQDLRSLGGALGYRQVAWSPPLETPALEALAASGFARSWEGFVWLFEQRRGG